MAFKANAKSFILTCPRCRKADKLYIRRGDGRFVCWVCRDSEGYEGAPEWVFTDLTGLSIAELRKRLYGEDQTPTSVWLDISIRDFFDEDDDLPTYLPDELPEVEPDPGFRELTSNAGKPGLDYLQGRGLGLDLLQKYEIKYYPARHAVVFPVRSRGKLLGWQTRYIGPIPYVDEETGELVSVPKAMTSYGLQKDRTFMLIDNLQESDHAILCEGPIDSYKADLCGGNINSLGKSVSSWQLQILRHSGIRKLYLAQDPDAFMESARVLRELVTDIEIYDMRAPAEFEDIGAMTPTDVLELYKRAPRLDAAHLYVYVEDRYGA